MKPNPLLSPSHLKVILRWADLYLLKKKGQNFLIDGNILGKIIDAAELTRKDRVLEIGGGLGTLTMELCRRAGKVAVVEWDRGLVKLLRRNCSTFKNLEVIEADILKVDLTSIVGSLRGKDSEVKVVANLPYSISGPLLVKLLESEAGFSSFVLMLQKEVGERITSPPGSKKYGALSVLSQMYGRPRAIASVSRNCFYPRPRVDSVLLRIEVLPKRAFPVADIALWERVVKAAFGRRRKMLKNTLVQDRELGYTEPEIVRACGRIKLDPHLRAEQIPVKDFARLADALQMERS